MTKLRNIDIEIFKLIEKEKKRQQEVLELIPSENIVSRAVLEAQGSILTNKYSEGYPNKRYYGGNKFIDLIEQLAIERAKKLFGAEHVNVQPYSGSPANIEVYCALLNFGDKILGMNLSHGGHLTHGHKVNFSGKVYNFIQYGVDKETGFLDYNKIAEIAAKEKPKLILSGATAYPREIDFKKFHKIAEENNAISMADIAHIAGLIVGKVHQTPFPFTDIVTTTTHKTLRGPRSAIILCKKEYAKKIDKAVFPGMQGGPHEHTIAAKAVCFKECLEPEFKKYAEQIVKNAKILAQELKEKGFNLVSGGTDNHLILIDLTNKSITGQQAEKALDEANITVNKNTIPYDKRTPLNPSGIRLGTPCLTTKGMKENEMVKVAEFISKVLNNINNTEVKKQVKEEIIKLNKNFPIYQ